MDYFDAFLHDEHVVLSGGLFLVGLVCVSALLLQYHITHVWKLIYLPEAAATMTCGIIISAILRYAGVYALYEKDNNESHIGMLNFNEAMFFFALLPPILFNSGYHLNRHLFYSNFGGVLGLAFVGPMHPRCLFRFPPRILTLSVLF